MLGRKHPDCRRFELKLEGRKKDYIWMRERKVWALPRFPVLLHDTTCAEASLNLASACSSRSGK